MKFSFFLLFYCMSLINVPTITEIRQAYKNVKGDKQRTEALFNQLNEVDANASATLYAYKGAVTIMMAKHAKKIKERKRYFKAGAAMIESAIAKNPDNIETRMIRLSVQENAPKFLKYHKDKEMDKKFILEHLSSTKSEALKKYVTGFVLHSKSFTASEKEIFE